jgi:pSer/pThr/pTyr-binding forkhead associated (FHA) protein
MPAYLQVVRSHGREVAPLDGERVSIGREASNEIPIPEDKLVSRLHAVLERYASGWALRDLASSNGTFVNGERILGERVLHHGDEIRVGETRLIYSAEDPSGASRTTAAQPAPELTPRERDVLLSLCRPVLSGSLLNEPASLRTIAQELVLSESAVKKHVLRLYDKFRLYEEDRRRGTLANEAIRRGAVSLADLREFRPPGS